MDLNADNKIRIDKYIQAHPESKINASFPIFLQGIKREISIYRLPTDMLFYNIRNGRFAVEYKEMEKEEGGSLMPENQDDADKIKHLLQNLDKSETNRTKEDLKIRGQWNCGIITHDGYVIDGNRRMSIISKLYEETELEKWKYLDVARLETFISPEDLWKLEAGIQLGRNEIVRYGPVNELLKLREGIGAGLTKKSIASALYAVSEEEIDKKLKLLELIEQYLNFMGTPEKYSNIRNRVEHFINLQKIIAVCIQTGYEIEKTVKIKYASFQLISEDIQHLELRKIHDIIKKDITDAVYEIETAGSKLEPKSPQSLTVQKKIEDETCDIIDEFEGEDKGMSDTYTHFINARDLLDVSNNEGKEMLLLNRAEKNLRPLLDYQGNKFPPEAIYVIKKISEYVEVLTKRLRG